MEMRMVSELISTSIHLLSPSGAVNRNVRKQQQNEGLGRGIVIDARCTTEHCVYNMSKI